MVVFGAGVAAALASMFFAYLRRTVVLRAPERAPQYHSRMALASQLSEARGDA